MSPLVSFVTLPQALVALSPFLGQKYCPPVDMSVTLLFICLVASKIRYLQEYHNRVLHSIYPVPSGTDIANTLKYFSQTLLR